MQSSIEVLNHSFPPIGSQAGTKDTTMQGIEQPLQSVCQQVAAHGQRVRYEDTNLGVGIWKRCQVVNTKTNRVTSAKILC